MTQENIVQVPAPVPVPGWYTDGGGQTRWWDGFQWGAYALQPGHPGVPGSQQFPQQHYVPANPPSPYPTPVPGFVLSLVAAVTVLTPIGFLCGLIGLIMSFNSMHATPLGYPGRGLAVTGFVIGIVMSIASLLFMLSTEY